jgi:hypothetical protein
MGKDFNFNSGVMCWFVCWAVCANFLQSMVLFLKTKVTYIFFYKNELFIFLRSFDENISKITTLVPVLNQHLCPGLDRAPGTSGEGPEVGKLLLVSQRIRCLPASICMARRGHLQEAHWRLVKFADKRCRGPILRLRDLQRQRCKFLQRHG